ncbi:hypothetical protein [Thiomicrorhabdus sp. 6S3-12]|uniref:hypothetical protein n=1 Tax=Thiomicrorhabdus sp. 6S3-12 TaxID=2819681 RepID=UPI001AAD6DBA|nr:hypothetical protein [Thiomicrorhabdus sp. 6S3-12]MBO1924087.1 hypothetical protein [Thiomicrorhabdus sp. 6S3-12]
MHRRASLFLLLAWVFGIIGMLLGVFLEPMWFARFGSLVVLFAVMSEYALLHGEFDVLYRKLDKLDVGEDIPDLSPSKWQRKKVWAAHLTVVVGTLVWGFGDLLIWF